MFKKPLFIFAHFLSTNPSSRAIPSCRYGQTHQVQDLPHQDLYRQKLTPQAQGVKHCLSFRESPSQGLHFPQSDGEKKIWFKVRLPLFLSYVSNNLRLTSEPLPLPPKGSRKSLRKFIILIPGDYWLTFCIVQSPPFKRQQCRRHQF